MARVSINDAFLDSIRSKLGDQPPAEITEEALTLFSWAVDEVASGKTIRSAKDGGREVSRLAMPALHRRQT